MSLNNLAHLLQEKGDLAGAEPLFRRALEAQERTLGPEHPHTLMSLTGVAALLQAKDDLVGAETFLRRALEAQERTLGPHPATLTSLYNLASLLYTKSDLAEAETLCRRALEAQERTLGHEHPDTLASLNYLAALLKANKVLSQPLRSLRDQAALGPGLEGRQKQVEAQQKAKKNQVAGKKGDRHTPGKSSKRKKGNSKRRS